MYLTSILSAFFCYIQNGGQCQCKTNVEGRQCDTCKASYFNLDASNLNGCEVCQCYTAGTVNASNYCDMVSSQCNCKLDVTGLLCDTCKEGYFSMNNSNVYGCDECMCDPAGTQVDVVSCHQQSGQCSCRNHTTGSPYLVYLPVFRQGNYSNVSFS